MRAWQDQGGGGAPSFRPAPTGHRVYTGPPSNGASSSFWGCAGSPPINEVFHTGIGVDLCHSVKFGPAEACYSSGTLVLFERRFQEPTRRPRGRFLWAYLYGVAWDKLTRISTACDARALIMRHRCFPPRGLSFERSLTGPRGAYDACGKSCRRRPMFARPRGACGLGFAR